MSRGSKIIEIHIADEEIERQKQVLNLIEHLNFRRHGLIFQVSCFAPFKGYALVVKCGLRMGKLTKAQADYLLASEDQYCPVKSRIVSTG